MARRMVQARRRKLTWVTGIQHDTWDTGLTINVPRQDTIVNAGTSGVPTGSTLLRIVGSMGIRDDDALTPFVAKGFAGIYFDTHGALTLDPASTADISTGAWLWWKAFPLVYSSINVDEVSPAGNGGVVDFDIRVKRKLDDAENEIQFVTNMPSGASTYSSTVDCRCLIMLP